MRMKISFISMIALIYIPLLIVAQEPSWLARIKQTAWIDKVNKIEVLKTTRAEAEQILGKPEVYKDSIEDSFIENYTIENGRVTVTYTTEECSSDSGKVNKNVIEEIDFVPNAYVLFSKLKIPMKQFNKSKENDTPILSYENKLNGITFDVLNKKINAITFFPSTQAKFKCP